MQRTIWTLLAVVLTGCVAACSQAAESSAAAAPKADNVAIIDLDRIAHALGRDEVMKRTMQQLQQDLETKLGQMRDQLQSAINTEAAKFGEKPTEEQQQQLNVMRGQAQQRFQAGLQQAQTQGQTKQMELIKQFREEVRPIARQVAKDKGMGIVLVSTDVVLDFDPAVDITDGVITKMRELPAATSQPAATPAPATQPAAK